jgi:hypothetical protein
MVAPGKSPDRMIALDGRVSHGLSGFVPNHKVLRTEWKTGSATNAYPRCH